MTYLANQILNIKAYIKDDKVIAFKRCFDSGNIYKLNSYPGNYNLVTAGNL